MGSGDKSPAKSAPPPSPTPAHSRCQIYNLYCLFFVTRPSPSPARAHIAPESNFTPLAQYLTGLFTSVWCLLLHYTLCARQLLLQRTARSRTWRKTNIVKISCHKNIICRPPRTPRTTARCRTWRRPPPTPPRPPPRGCSPRHG